MGLKDKQEREIVHVLMDCCLQEKKFNAFYAVLGEKFCSHDRRFQVLIRAEPRHTDAARSSTDSDTIHPPYKALFLESS